MKYDFLIVGAGLFGAVFAYEAKKRGKKVLVIDKREHIAGNIYTENVDGIEVRTSTEYKDFIKENPDIADRTVYTGMIDEFFDYQLGVLEYRRVYFEDERLDTDNYQGNAVVNYTERDVEFTRIIEHKHFEYGNQDFTIISKEYPSEWQKGEEPYYPINNEKNNALYESYVELSKKRPEIIFGGRLGAYKYYDMDKVVEAALECVERNL